MVILGSAWLKSTLKCSGKPRKVSSFPATMVSRMISRHNTFAGGARTFEAVYEAQQERSVHPGFHPCISFTDIERQIEFIVTCAGYCLPRSLDPCDGLLVT